MSEFSVDRLSLPFPRKGTETLGLEFPLQDLERCLSLPFPRKGTETLPWSCRLAVSSA